MSRIATAITAAVLVAASAQFAAAERRSTAPATATNVEMVEVSAAQVLSPKERNARNLSASDKLSVTNIQGATKDSSR